MIMAERLVTDIIEDLPSRIPFVILDLAYHPSVLEWIYEEVEARQPGSCRPLLLGTDFQERWQVGPALVDLRYVPGARDDLISKYKETLPGIFLTHPAERFDEVAAWLQQFLFMSRGAQMNLMRFYDPRVFGSFLSVLDPQQYEHFIPPGVTWRNKIDRKSTRLNSSHVRISYAVFCLKKKKKKINKILRDNKYLNI